MNLFRFMEYAGRLKRLRRTGWLIRGVPEPESVADHSYRAALLGMVLSDMRGLDTEKVLKMLLLHDLAEAIVGDMTPEAGEFVDKENAERAAVVKILAGLPEPLRDEYLRLWEEYVRGETEEAITAREADRAEMAFQALEYEMAGVRGLEEFRRWMPDYLSPTR